MKIANLRDKLITCTILVVVRRGAFRLSAALPRMVSAAHPLPRMRYVPGACSGAAPGSGRLLPPASHALVGAAAAGVLFCGRTAVQTLVAGPGCAGTDRRRIFGQLDPSTHDAVTRIHSHAKTDPCGSVFCLYHSFSLLAGFLVAKRASKNNIN